MSGNLFDELKRRQVFKVGAAYLLVAWLAVQGASIGFPAFDAPPWALRVFILVALLGFPVAVVLAWVFESTSEGMKFDPVKTGTKRIVAVAIALAALAVGWYLKGQPAFRASDVTATAASAATRHDQAAGPAIPDQSIAVLPFENLSADPDNAFFATGIQDEILTSLAKVGGLKVISRTSTIKYGAKPGNLKEIALELGVAHILEGTVQRYKNNVRVNVQLIDAATDSHRWADSYDRPLDDMFAVQSEVAQTIAKALNASLTMQERAAITAAPTRNEKAYEDYLRARAIILESSSYRATNVNQVTAALESAVAADPAFTLAWVELSQEHVWSYFSGFDPSAARLAKGKAALERAEALAPATPEVLLARAFYTYYGERRFREAREVARKVQALRPNDARAWYMSALLSRRLGDYDESLSDFDRARQLSPNDFAVVGEDANTLYAIARDKEALARLEVALSLQPGDPASLAIKHLVTWRSQGVAAGARMLAALPGDTPVLLSLRAKQAWLEHDDARAAELYARAIAADKGGGDETPTAFAGYVPANVGWRLDLAILEQRLGRRDQAQQHFTALIADADQALHGNANPYVEAAWRSARGLALAGLGRKDEATAEGARALALVPTSKEAFEGPVWVSYVARIRALNGQAAEAATLLRQGFAGPVVMDPPQMVRLDPFWDPVRRDPAFRPQ